MAVTRRLTIAGMKGAFALRFRDVANHDAHFQAICGGSITVNRSPNGTTYVVSSDTDHFRVFATIVTPNDLPNLFYWDDCTAYGWWHLEGYQQKDFERGNWPRVSETLDTIDVEQASQSTELGKPKEANEF